MMNTHRSTKTARTSRSKRETLIMSALDLPRKIAKSLAKSLPKSVSREDLEQDGMVGLIDAAAKFNPARGVKFPLYASPRVLGAMLDGLRGNSCYPRLVDARRRAVEAARESFLQRHGHPPTQDELAKLLETMDYVDHSPRCGDRAQKILRDSDPPQFSSIDDASPQQGGKEQNELCFLTQSREMDPSQAAIAGEIRHVMAMGMDNVDVLIARSFLLDNLTLKEIGRIVGVSESCIGQHLGSRSQRTSPGIIPTLRENPHLRDMARHDGGNTATLRTALQLRMLIHPKPCPKEVRRTWRQGRRRMEAEGRKKSQAIQLPAQDGPASIPISSTPTIERSLERMAC